eukprot:TRINITY_DN2279_c0_g2_i5.p1 TRINITY_DN2279_c0_g2~~TRINITY_DN2279_c0_g2_i5.p1  ORF type:complete len:298 (+),score=52.53 TRINITY_DN2279_c0_g2_i5:35-928(+)
MGCQTSTDSKSSKSAKKRKEESQSTSESPDKENPIEPKIAVLAENSPNNSRTPSKEKADLIWIKMQPTVCSICNKESTLFSPFSKSNELVCSKCAGPLPESDVKADYLRANAGKAKAGSSTNTPLKNRANDRLKTPVINSSNKEQSAVPNVRKPSSARQTPLKGMNIKRCNPGDHVLQVQRVLHKKECEICKEAEGLVCRRCQYLICQKCNKSLLTGGKAVKKPQSAEKEASPIETSTVKEDNVQVQDKVEPKTQLQEMSNLLKDLQKKNEDMQVALSVVIDRTNVASKSAKNLPFK